MKSKIILAIIVTMALVVRLWKIDNPVADWHAFRQADTAAVTRNFVNDGVDLLRPRYDDLSNIQSGKDNPEGWRMVEFPVYNFGHYLVDIGVQGFGSSQLRQGYDGQAGVQNSVQHPVLGQSLTPGVDRIAFSGRLTTVISSLFALCFLYGIVRRLSGERTALVAAGVFAVLPYSIYYSRVILPDMMAVMWALGSLYWLSGVERSRSRSMNLVLSAVFASLALLTKPTAGFLLTPALFLFFLKLRKNYWFIGLLVYWFIALAPLLWWRNWIQQFPEGIPAWKWLLWEEIKPFQPAWWRWLFFDRIGNLLLGGWGLVFLVLGILFNKTNEQMSNKSKIDSVFYFTWLAGAMLYLVVFASGNVRHDYYQIILIPVICVFVANGIVYLWTNEDFNKILSIPASLFIILASLFYSFYQIRGYYQINDPAIIEAGLAVDELTPKDAKVIAPYFGDTSFLYQTRRKGWPLVTHYPIEEMIARGATHYVSTTQDDFTKELMGRFTMEEQTDKYIIIKLSLRE